MQGRGGRVRRTKDFGRKRGCLRCGRKRGIVRRYGLHVCRQCFREIAYELGFRKYS
ncbi:MAG TPA: 30S ribosomal protein S14 [Thermoplasmata archaeon]|nr:30S ribosomal protein S14 [Thermoplasmata archaeon]